MGHEQRNRIFLPRKQRHKMDVEIRSIIVLDFGLEIRKGVDVAFRIAPVIYGALACPVCRANQARPSTKTKKNAWKFREKKKKKNSMKQLS